MAELPEHQIQYIVDMISAGEDLPSDYKHLLFPPERQEYELVFAGKEREEDILVETMAVPLQAVKTFGNGEGSEWRNMLVFGDNLQAMKTLWEMKKRDELVNADGSLGVKYPALCNAEIKTILKGKLNCSFFFHFKRPRIFHIDADQIH